MGSIKNKIYDWKDRLRKGKMFTLVVTLIAIIITLTVYSLTMWRKYREISENDNNQAFYELVEYINNTEKLLAKATISNDSSHGSMVLTNICKTSALAQTYLSRIPIPTQDLENTNKFLNQVGDYCYALSKKTINGENLSQEDLDNLTKLHGYSLELENTINQLEEDLYSGTIKWGKLKSNGDKAFQEDNSSLEKASFSSIEEDLHQYTGLIYDGAFSENQSNFKGEGLTGEDIDEEQARNIAKKIIGEDKIKEIQTNGESENARIKCFNFNAKLINNSETQITISKKGGHVVSMNNNREVVESTIADDDAISAGKDFLSRNEFESMTETYYMKNQNIITINYAYKQENVVVYPDLIKIKIAMDNGEILGMETTNYLNSHKGSRETQNVKITKEDAVQLVNKNLEIKATDLAIIPTEYNTEVLCWEIKGTVNSETEGNKISNDFLVYINAETGKEQDILMIVDTPNGTLTM